MISNEVNFCLNFINSVKYLSANIILLITKNGRLLTKMLSIRAWNYLL